MKKILVNVTIAAVMLLGLSVVGAHAQRPVLGGYKAAAVDNADVVAAADFAVSYRSEHNSEQEGLELSSIDKAETQTVAGTNFRLCLTVSLDGEEQQVQAVIFRSLKDEFSLKSWEPKDCS